MGEWCLPCFFCCSASSGNQFEMIWVYYLPSLFLESYFWRNRSTIFVFGFFRDSVYMRFPYSTILQYPWLADELNPTWTCSGGSCWALNQSIHLVPGSANVSLVYSLVMKFISVLFHWRIVCFFFTKERRIVGSCWFYHLLVNCFHIWLKNWNNTWQHLTMMPLEVQWTMQIHCFWWTIIIADLVRIHPGVYLTSSLDYLVPVPTRACWFHFLAASKSLGAHLFE